MRGRSARSIYRKRVAWILVACAIVYLAGNAAVPLWDRDEPRYAQTSRQMLQSGDWVVPRFLDQVRTAKPPLIYWCQAGAMKLAGDTGFAARLPSVIAMLLTLLALSIALPRRIGRRRAAWSVFILASSGLAIAAAKMCLTDSVLLLFITVAQGCLYIILQRRAGWMTWIALGVAVGLAGLTKGPVVLGVMGMTLLVLAALGWRGHRRSRDARAGGFPIANHDNQAPAALRAASDRASTVPWRWRFDSSLTLKIVAAIVLVAAICAPWLILIQHREPSFLRTIIGHDVINRMRTGLEGHRGPPGYYLLTIWVTFFPWSILLPATLVFAWKNRRDALVRFCLAATVGPWLMFEIVQTKLPHYLLPVFPPLAILTARMLMRAAPPGRSQLRTAGARASGLVFCFVALVIAIVPLGVSFMSQLTSITTMISIAIAAVGFECARSVFRAFRRGKPLIAALAMGAGTLALVVLLYAGWLPSLEAMQTSRRVADILREEHATQPGDVIMIDYKEPSLAFHQGGTIREESNNQFLTLTDPSRWPTWIVLTKAIWDASPQDVRDRLQIVDSVHGWWYANRGRSVDVLVVRKR